MNQKETVGVFLSAVVKNDRLELLVHLFISCVRGGSEATRGHCRDAYRVVRIISS